MRTPADPDRPISGRARVREQAPRERTYRGGTEAERLGQRLAPGHGRESALDGVIQAAQVVGNAGQGHGRPLLRSSSDSEILIVGGFYSEVALRNE